MAGTKEGGKKAAAKNLAKNPNFYADIGRLGGRNGNTGGFAAYIECECPILPFTHHKAQCAGSRGGRKSRRPKDKPTGGSHHNGSYYEQARKAT